MKKDTRSRILEAARTLIVRSGYDRMSIWALSEASGASNGSIYHHFGSRDGVLRELLRRAIADLQFGLIRTLLAHQEDAAAGVRAVVAYLLAWSEQRPDDARLLLTHRDLVVAHPVDPGFFPAVERWLLAHAQAGRMPEVRPRTAYALVVAPAQAFADLWLRGSDPTPPTAHAGRLGDAAWAALLAAGPDPAR